MHTHTLTHSHTLILSHIYLQWAHTHSHTYTHAHLHSHAHTPTLAHPPHAHTRAHSHPRARTHGLAYTHSHSLCRVLAVGVSGLHILWGHLWGRPAPSLTLCPGVSVLSHLFLSAEEWMEVLPQSSARYLPCHHQRELPLPGPSLDSHWGSGLNCWSFCGLSHIRAECSPDRLG